MATPSDLGQPQGRAPRGLAARLLVMHPFWETVRRLPQVLLGLWLFGIGIALMVAGDLGVAPWDVFHQGVARSTGTSLGTVIVLTGIVVVLGFVPLREQVGLGTILNAVLIGISVDQTLGWLHAPDVMWARIALTTAGPPVIAVASGLYIGGGLGPGPRDGIMTGLAKRGFAVWKVRTSLEVGVMLLGVVLGGSIGFGTAWFAISIGPLVHFCLPRLTLRPAPATVASDPHRDSVDGTS